MTTTPHPSPRPRPHGRRALAAVVLLAVFLLPAVLIGTGQWWLLVILALALWVVVIRGRLWRP